MTSIIIVDKSASIKATKIKGLDRDTLYKKCGFRKADGFELRNKFKIKKFGVDTVEVWARDSGKAGSENKYELPPPIDHTLYFGSIAIAAFDDNDEFIDLTEDTWKKVYEHLFGGFEDIDDADSEAEYIEDELDSVPTEKKTKSGYLKDGFVVDTNCDSDEEEEDCSEEESDEEEEDDESESDDEPDNEDIDDMSGGSELEEEEYYYSDED
jgi:hypothetical protein